MPLMASVGLALVTTLSIMVVSLSAVSLLNASAMTCDLVSESTVRSEARTRSTRVGRISLPSLAMAWATIAICNGVAVVSPWPMEANASLSAVELDGNVDAVAVIGVPVFSVPSMVMVLPKPSLVAISLTLSCPRATPSWAKAVFEDQVIASCSEIFPSVPLAWYTAFGNWVLVPGSVYELPAGICVSVW